MHFGPGVMTLKQADKSLTEEGRKEVAVKKVCVALAVAGLFFGSAWAQEEEEEVSGVPVGEKAPPLKGEAWITKSGKAPDLKKKVYLVDFWFGR